MCIVHNLYCGYSLSTYIIMSIIMIDQNKTIRSEKSARVCRRLCYSRKMTIIILIIYKATPMIFIVSLIRGVSHAGGRKIHYQQ